MTHSKNRAYLILLVVPLICISSSAVPNTPTPLTVTPPQPSSTPSSSRGICNPLVAAGMVPTHLADIFCTPEGDPQGWPKRRRITKARVWTMLR